MDKPQYAILRFAKYKGPEIGHIEAHNERTKENTPAIPMWTPAGATSISTLFSRSRNTARWQNNKSLRPNVAFEKTAFV